MDLHGEGVPHIVHGLSACLGDPRHATNDPQFISASLENLGIGHDILIDLVKSLAGEDSFAALRLLQVSGVQRFGHIISAVPLPWSLTSHTDGMKLSRLHSQ